MRYTTEVIRKACDLANISTSSSELIVCMLKKAMLFSHYKEPEYGATSVESLLDNICHVTGYTREQLASKSRKRELVYVRHSYVQLASELFPRATLKYIGSFINKKHAMIIYYQYGVRNVIQKRETYINIKKELIHFG